MGPTLALALALHGSAHAGPVIVWLEPEVPAERFQSKAEALAGPAQDLALPDLAFPPEPLGDADTAAYKKLRDTVAAARSRWDAFEVEYGIATDLQGALTSVTVIRDERDVDALIEALALQGAAVDRAFEEVDFQEGARAEPFRVTYAGTPQLIAPWVDAVALDPDHQLGQDVAEQATWPDLQRLQGKLAPLADGSIDLAGLPAGATLWIDGVAQSPGGVAKVRPGHHLVYLQRGGVIYGRSRVSVEPGQTVTLAGGVSREALSTARAKVVTGATTGFPDEVKRAIEKQAAWHKGPVFVAAVDDGQVHVLPYAQGAELLGQRLVTFTFTGDIGPELVVSSLFEDSGGSPVTAPAGSAGLGFEFGVSHAALLGGLDVALAPGQTVVFAAPDGSRNIHTSALPQPYGGLGLYALRPTGDRPYILLAGTYGWNGPAHYAAGGRLTLGMPLRTRQWFRLTLGASHAGKSAWEGDPVWDTDPDGTVAMTTLFFRVGVAGGL